MIPASCGSVAYEAVNQFVDGHASHFSGKHDHGWVRLICTPDVTLLVLSFELFRVRALELLSTSAFCVYHLSAQKALGTREEEGDAPRRLPNSAIFEIWVDGDSHVDDWSEVKVREAIKQEAPVVIICAPKDDIAGT